MPRFVVLAHDSPRGLHWDLMLEEGPVLKTWALAELPEGAGPIVADALPDHRPAYLDYEGPISGDRGSVTRWDQGTYELVRRGDAEWLIELLGERLSGRASLRRSEAPSQRWEFRYPID